MLERWWTVLRSAVRLSLLQVAWRAIEGVSRLKRLLVTPELLRLLGAAILEAVRCPAVVSAGVCGAIHVGFGCRSWKFVVVVRLALVNGEVPLFVVDGLGEVSLLFKSETVLCGGSTTSSFILCDQIFLCFFLCLSVTNDNL